jgi:RNA polymerase sigma-70 factor (ECF subfamily)
MSYALNTMSDSRHPEWHWQADAATALLPIEGMVEAARLGDEFAFGRLVDYYRTAAERIAQQILHTEEGAADAVQEAFIKAHRAMSRFQDGNFRSWFLRIVTNTCYDHLRRQKRRAAISLDELTEQAGLDHISIHDLPGDDPEALVMQNEGMRSLLKAIDDLPSWHRNVVMLVDVQGYDYSEAAEILGLPLGTVKSRLSRARNALRDDLVRTGVVAGRLA